MSQGVWDNEAEAVARQFQRREIERELIAAAMVWRENLHALDTYEELLRIADRLATFNDAADAATQREGSLPPALAPAGPKASPAAKIGPAAFFCCSDETPCCERRNVHFGFVSQGPVVFTCPRQCACHD